MVTETSTRVHEALELEFYIPASAWDHPATSAFLTRVYALVEGATVVGGAKGVWRGQTESTNLVRIIVRGADLGFDTAILTIQEWVRVLMVAWCDSPRCAQDSCIFTVRALSLYETRVTDNP